MMKLEKTVSTVLTREDHKRLMMICMERSMSNGKLVTISDILREWILPHLSVSIPQAHTEESPKPSGASNYDFGDISDMSINGE